MKPEFLDLIKELTASGVLKRKVESFRAPNHGSSCGEVEDVTLYWDESKLEWTSSKQFAMEGYVMKKLRPYIKESLK